MTNKSYKKKAYYEFPLSENRPKTEIVLAVLILLWMILPFAVTVAIVEVYKGVGTLLTRILLYGACIALNIVWYWRVFRIADRKSKPLVSLPKVRYYLNDPEGYKKITVESLTDGDTMNRLYHEGGLYIIGSDREGADFPGDPSDNGKLNYIFNLLKDKGLLAVDTIKMYEITKEAFLKNFAFYDPNQFYYDKIYVISYPSMDTDKAAYMQVRKAKQDPWYYWWAISDFQDLVEGYYTVHGGHPAYRYKDEAAKIP